MPNKTGSKDDVCGVIMGQVLQKGKCSNTTAHSIQTHKRLQRTSLVARQQSRTPWNQTITKEGHKKNVTGISMHEVNKHQEALRNYGPSHYQKADYIV